MQMLFSMSVRRIVWILLVRFYNGKLLSFSKNVKNKILLDRKEKIIENNSVPFWYSISVKTRWKRITVVLGNCMSTRRKIVIQRFVWDGRSTVERWKRIAWTLHVIDRQDSIIRSITYFVLHFFDKNNIIRFICDHTTHLKFYFRFDFWTISYGLSYIW